MFQWNRNYLTFRITWAHQLYLYVPLGFVLFISNYISSSFVPCCDTGCDFRVKGCSVRFDPICCVWGHAFFMLFLSIFLYLDSRCCLCRLTGTRRVHRSCLSFRDTRGFQSGSRRSVINFLVFCFRISLFVIINYAQHVTFFVTFHNL